MVTFIHKTVEKYDGCKVNADEETPKIVYFHSLKESIITCFSWVNSIITSNSILIVAVTPQHK